MDPLSLTVSATALITVCVQVGSLCKNYIDEVVDIDNVVRDLGLEVSALSDILANFRATLESDAFTAARVDAAIGHEGEHWRGVDRVLAECKGTVTDLRSILEGASRERGHLRRIRTQRALSKADGKVKSCKIRLQSCKESLQISLQILSL